MRVLNDVGSEQGSTAVEGPERRSSAKDDIKSSIPEHVIEEVEALQEEETHDILQVFKDNCSSISSGGDDSGKPQKASVHGDSAPRHPSEDDGGGTAQSPQNDGSALPKDEHAASTLKKGVRGALRLERVSTSVRKQSSSSSKDSPRSSTPPQQGTGDHVAAVSDGSDPSEADESQPAEHANSDDLPKVEALQIGGQ